MYRDAIDDYHCKGLLVYCPSILKDKKTEYIKSLVGSAARVTYLPNLEEIYIEI